MYPLSAGIVVHSRGLWEELQASLRDLPVRIVMEQAEIADLDALVNRVERLRPDVVFLELSGASEPLDAVIGRIRTSPSAPAVLVLNQTADSAAILEAMREMQDAQQAAIKAIGVQMPAGAVQSFTRDAKTVDGVSFDEVKSPINLNGQNPQQMQAMQFISMIYGPQGPDMFTGLVDDQNLLTVMGLDDAGISAAISAAKAGDDPLAKIGTTKAVSSELPPQRFGAVYVPLDLWATTGLGYAKMFGMDMGVTMPDNLPPMGCTMSTDASAVRLDSYLPSQLLQALTAAGMQCYTKMQNQQPHNGGAAPGGM